MNPNPPSRTRLPFRRPPPRRATARRGRPGGLPRFTTGSARDAINLRWNYKDAINLATGEWTRAGYRAPACYVTNTRPIVRSTFSAAPADLPSVTLLAETDAAIGGFAATNVAFAGGAGVRTSISTALGVAETSIVRIPCLYPLPNIGATGWNDVSTLEPNPVNMTVLVSQNGGRRILVPLPRFIVFAEKLGETFIDLGYSEDEVLFVESAGPRGWFGEVHCATNVKRSRGQ